MVSRIEFFCPGCGAPEVPELILREYYHCPNCEQDTPRENLDRQRRNNYLLAGTGGLFEITDMGGFALTSNVANPVVGPATVDVKSNELFVCILGTIGGSLDPVSVTLGASDAMTEAIGIGEAALIEPQLHMYYYNGTITTPGLQTITILFQGGGIAQDICVLMLKIKGNAASPIDKSAAANQPVGQTTLTTGNMTAQAGFNHLAIGAVVSEYEDASIDEKCSFRNGFNEQRLIRNDRALGGNLYLLWAIRQLNSKVPVACISSKVSNTSSTIAVFTVKPR